MDIRLGFADESNFAEDTTTRQAYDLLADGFVPGFNGPLLATVEISNPGDAAAVEALASSINSTAGVAAVFGPTPNDPASPSAFLLRVIPTSDPQEQATEALVGTLRNDVIPAATAGMGLDVNITGFVAADVDFGG
jgi:RND superfamily putative drug exporter